MGIRLVVIQIITFGIQAVFGSRAQGCSGSEPLCLGAPGF